MKKVNNNTEASNSGVPKQKERHIVSWSQEEDDILREQIRVHGIENWAIIASKFKDKTTRQCRRRWFTYLNSDFKKGGWSPEEDMLLCEAQKIFGNRWTEIAKVVSGRTDNAVKNRFTTLCKRRAKQEALGKENDTASYINLNNKRAIFSGGSETAVPVKKIRTYISNTVAENREERLTAEENNKSDGTFLKKDDPKVIALMQQAELLSSLAIKVNSQKTDQSLESAWMVLQNLQKQNKDSVMITFPRPGIEFQFENCNELVEDLRSGNEGSESSLREPHMCASSPASSEYSTGSTLLSSACGDKKEACQAEICVLHKETGKELQSNPVDDQCCLSVESEMCLAASANEVHMVAGDDIKENHEAACEYSNTETSSPLHVTPLFRSLAAAIPSPKFSESEKHFLMKTLGMESAAPSAMTNPSQPPPCKRSLLHCL